MSILLPRAANDPRPTCAICGREPRPRVVAPIVFDNTVFPHISNVIYCVECAAAIGCGSYERERMIRKKRRH